MATMSDQHYLRAIGKSDEPEQRARLFAQLAAEREKTIATLLDTIATKDKIISALQETVAAHQTTLDSLDRVVQAFRAGGQP